MAQPVIVNIPMIGDVEAKNAASEHTLNEILKIIKKFDRNLDGGKEITDGGGGGGGGDGGGGAGGTSKLGKLGEAAGAVGKKLLFAGSMVGRFSDSITKTISQFANVGDSLEAAAGTLSFIPVLGTMFGAVASAAEKTTSAFQAAGAAGASFNGSVMEFSKAASAAGMTMADFGNFVKNNGQAMLGLGGTVEEGAKRFGAISKQVRNTSNDLFALGFSTKDLNQGIGNYSALLRQQGMQGNKTNSELAVGARKYMKEMDALARITGEERSAKEAQTKQLATDAQFQAAMAGMNEEVRDSFRDTVLGLPGPLQNFAKDVLATGTATSEENQKLLAMMPQSAAMLQEFQAKTQRGEAITMEERNRLNNLLKSEGGAALQNIKQSGAASSELAGLVGGLASTYQINTDAVKKSTKEQEEAKKKTDALNAAVEKNRATLAEFSNGFQMALANSGLLNDLFKTFEFVANFVQTYLIPAFNVIGMVVSGLASVIMDMIKPAFEAVGYIVGQVLYPVFRNFAAFVAVDLMPPIQSFASTISESLSPAVGFLGGVINDWVLPAFRAVGSFLQENMVPIFYAAVAGITTYLGILAVQNAEMIKNTVVMGARSLWEGILAAKTALLTGAMTALASPVVLLVAGIAAVVALFVTLYRSGFTLSTAWEALKDNLERFGMNIMEFIDNIRSKLPEMLGGMSKEEKEARAKERDERRKELDEKEAARDKEREAKRAERGIEDQDKKRKAEAARIDQKVLGIKGEQLAQAKEEQKTSKDYNNTIQLLKDEARAQKSGLVKDPTTGKPATGKAEATKKDMEAKAEAKAAEEAKQKEAAKAAGETTEGKPAVPEKPGTQESAETLLASLNTKMDQLIRINRTVADVNERQLTVQQGMTGDLYVAA
jgi:hypothetical protein